ncbi:phage tail tube protein [Roseospira visakhapatnamensis]|uniref:Tail tube protein n=1 Tax=Roseospira visakhapatnamensis TaxID=390880 RepID=A0A7W6RFP8_9PROT|nr:phage tail tube protein [Roseospira visakhapatnamensis]MBB4267731.1 hypothetical protein [Roseospira visakhapatnamensis]
MATSAYFAGAQTNDLQIGIQRETTWGTAPTSGTYNGMRVQSIGLGERANRTRPGEIRNDMQVSASVLQDIAASGGIQFGVSYGNQDLVWPTLFTGDWSTAVAVSATDIAADDSGSQFTSTTTDFTGENISVGQWIKVAGFTTTTNNGFFRVTSVAANALGVSPAPGAAEAAGDTVTMVGSRLVNGTTVNSLAIQERYSSSLGFMYTGCIATGGQINAQRGQFFSGTVDFAAKAEDKAASVVATMGAAPTARVMNTVGHMQAIALGSLTSAKVNSVTTTITREGAGADYALGGASAVGVRPGSFSASGQIEIYFADFDAYDLYKAETQIMAYYRVTDSEGNTYIVHLPKVVLGAVTKQRGGPNQPVMATFEFMAEPDPDLGHTMAIDRFAA